MDDAMMEDEKKPFDAEIAGNEDETQPDPDEAVMMEAGYGRVWLVKVLNTAASADQSGSNERRYHHTS